MALGGTVGELQQRMSLAEYYQWVRYRNKNGQMNDVRRFDRPAALLAHLITCVASKNPKKINDFLPFGVEEKEPTIEDFIKVFGSKDGQRR